MALKPASVQWSTDGSLLSLDYGDVYFQRGHGIAESRYVFIEKNRLEERFKPLEGAFRLAELGFGSGLNFLLTADLFDKQAPAGARLVYVSFEKHPLRLTDIEKVQAHFPDFAPLSAEFLRQYPPLVEGFHNISLLNGRIRLVLIFGDVAETLPQLSGVFDAWYLDGFTPAKNPAMWTEDLFPQIAARTAPGGTLATFSVAGHMRRGLAACGFAVEKLKGYGVKWSMVAAQFKGETTPKKPREKIAVIGAGIAGCSAAHALARRGYQVTVYDRHAQAACEASGNPAAIVYPKLTVDASPMGLYHSHAFCFTKNLLENLRLPSWQPCGVLHLDMDAQDQQRTQTLFEKQQYPADFAQKTADGYLQPGAGFLSPPEFCRALLDHPNIKTVFGHDARDIDADIIIIAQGNDSKSRKETEWLPLQSLRGQITYLKTTEKSQTLDHVVCHDGYITPAINGMHCIGATFQKEEPEEPELRDEDHAENLAKLNNALPIFSFTEKDIAGGRTGYRVTTPDKLPLIGPCPDYDSFVKKENRLIENLYITTGFGAHGMTGAPLAGEIIACMISGEPLPVPQNLLDHLRPERFILRDIKRKRIP